MFIILNLMIPLNGESFIPSNKDIYIDLTLSIAIILYISFVDPANTRARLLKFP